MDTYQWDGPLLVGVAQLDEQHRLLHRLIMSLIRALEKNLEDSGSEDSFTEIFKNLVEHFKAEEEYLENQGYPDLLPVRRYFVWVTGGIGRPGFQRRAEEFGASESLSA